MAADAAPAVPAIPAPFADSRRLTGANLFFAVPAAVLDALGPQARDADALARWRSAVRSMAAALGWGEVALAERAHAGGTLLALTAPVDALFAATELDEWAWCAAVGFHAFHAPGHPASWDADAARETLRALVAAEARPALRALLAESEGRGVPALLDDEMLTLGLGSHGCSWPLDALPAPAAVPWAELRGIPVALVTGSNGKTTTTRLLAAMLAANGAVTGHSCTDGVIVGGAAVERGDWSGPAGARRVLRDPRVTAAVLETARGGLLRRGLAVARADVAVVTNTAEDHFGEYGIDDLDGLADAKLTVARALGDDGVLVLNADDPRLCARADAGLIRGHDGRPPRLAWFADDFDAPRLRAHRAAGGLSAGVRAGVLLLSDGSAEAGIADTASMPLAAGGIAAYNVANAAAAGLLAFALGVPTATIAQVLARFGSDPDDNPGRLQRWHFGGLQVLMDYAHNPDGLRGLLRVARAAGDGRLGMLLGQAGNRPDEDLRALAAVAAEAAPAFVVLKDIDGYLRGRTPGAVAAVLREALLARGIPDADMVTVLPEAEAARTLLRWSRPGDVLVMPVHSLGARAEVAAMLDELQLTGGMTARAGELPGAG
ncbi:Mur ligase family protein [Arenimonas composti]|uniref:Mur ligase central domain-containing protein n=1 Tax=Arenimonas composti TR7-09 = DSM 18010 TaxID=1121013 RepID=A0A091B8W6_9GAMM|nr:Mur ligase family protein [Arenimonas composti]KFN49088.1 hypothetical protein P873_12405 [Arenimonas composti TR7-09 = DSM 18010]